MSEWPMSAGGPRVWASTVQHADKNCRETYGKKVNALRIQRCTVKSEYPCFDRLFEPFRLHGHLCCDSVGLWHNLLGERFMTRDHPQCWQHTYYSPVFPHESGHLLCRPPHRQPRAREGLSELWVDPTQGYGDLEVVETADTGYLLEITGLTNTTLAHHGTGCRMFRSTEYRYPSTCNETSTISA